jgi:hypothetical protein
MKQENMDWLNTHSERLQDGCKQHLYDVKLSVRKALMKLYPHKITKESLAEALK